jgi:hypothetical protein
MVAAIARAAEEIALLNIGENAFEELPECIAGMESLIELWASDNLGSLPESIGSLQELRQIDLRGNPLKNPAGHLHAPAPATSRREPA